MKVKDPVCGMTVEDSDAVAASTYKGTTYFFCSPSCKEAFEKNPETYISGKSEALPKTEGAQGGVIHTCPMHPEVRQAGPGTCPKCGMALEPLETFPVSYGHNVRKSILAGLGGAAVLVFFYFILVTLLSGSWRHPLDELLELKYWIGALILGFGIQIGLFYHIRNAMHLKGHGGKAAAAGTGTSTVAMVACCAHHLADVLPIIGLAGVALFLSEYKIAFIAFGIISNAFGIVIMLRIIRKSAAVGRVSNH
jgi:YHS domain-containing protein